MPSITRILYDSTATIGIWRDDDGNKECFTLELPWQNNQHGISCIPKGTYTVQDYQSPVHGTVWQIMDVPDRSNIEIHSANKPSELLGCIAVGDKHDQMDGEIAVFNSKITLKMLRDKYQAPFTLVIG
jgi:hypothetical protein